MKNFNFKKSFFILSVVVISVVSFGFITVNAPSKVTICHVPPGNPGNCHEITISTNALQAHLNHGDRIVCNSAAELQEAHQLVRDYNINDGGTNLFFIINF